MGEEVPAEIKQLHGFKFSYGAFENPQGFVEAVRKMCTCPNYPTVKQAYRIKRLTDALQKELDSYMDLRKDMEKLEPEEYKAKEKELLAMEVDIKWSKLTTEEVECIQNLAPADLFALEFIADMPQ